MCRHPFSFRLRLPAPRASVSSPRELFVPFVHLVCLVCPVELDCQMNKTNRINLVPPVSLGYPARCHSFIPGEIFTKIVSPTSVDNPVHKSLRQ